MDEQSANPDHLVEVLTGPSRPIPAACPKRGQALAGHARVAVEFYCPGQRGA